MMEDLNSNKQHSYERAKKRVEELKGYYIHLTVYIIFNSFLFLNYFIGLFVRDGLDLQVVLFILFGWGVGLVFHTVHVFGFGKLFGRDWEQKKIRQFMEEDSGPWEK